MTTQVLLGKSIEGRDIEARVFGSDEQPTLLVFGGFHGDEPKTVTLASKLIELLEQRMDPRRAVRYVVVPVVSPDGYSRRRRRNARGVDINRNLPTENWAAGSRRSRMFSGEAAASEPETCAVIRAVERFDPAWIISIHSIDRGRFCNNYDGPGRALAEAMHRHNGYPVTGSIGYPTPGSLGTWAGVERGIPVVTLELPSHHSTKRCWTDNRDTLLLAADARIMTPIMQTQSLTTRR